MAKRDAGLPIIIGMNPPTKEILIFPHKHWDGHRAGYDLMINHAKFPDGTKRGQTFSFTDSTIERYNTACVLHFCDVDAMRRFGEILVEYADKHD